jgi:hypothetical protein
MVFPGKDWNQATPESQGIDSAKLRAALDYLARSLAEHGGADTVFIVRNGYGIWQGPECDREFQIFSGMAHGHRPNQRRQKRWFRRDSCQRGRYLERILQPLGRSDHAVKSQDPVLQPSPRS